MVRGISSVKKSLSKNAKRRGSQTKWLQRQLNDPYVKAAQIKGYRSRARFKLEQIDEAHHLFKPHQTVLDLGAAPGGWSRYVQETYPTCKVIAIDLLPIKPIEDVLFHQGDFTDPKTQTWIQSKIKGGKADVIMSDIAPNTIGVKSVDHLRLMAILNEVITFSKTHLKQGGSLIAKTFRGGTDADLLTPLKNAFKSVKHIKPPASRKDSVESFILAQHFKGYHL